MAQEAQATQFTFGEIFGEVLMAYGPQAALALIDRAEKVLGSNYGGETLTEDQIRALGFRRKDEPEPEYRTLADFRDAIEMHCGPDAVAHLDKRAEFFSIALTDELTEAQKSGLGLPVNGNACCVCPNHGHGQTVH